jgi:DNA-binding MarR family transcriptional regulator
MKRAETVERLDRAVIRFYERLSNWEESVAEQVGLTPRQCHAISELAEAGRIRMKALAERLGITTGTLTIMADRLENLKLVRRVEDPTDKRAFNIMLTDAGQEIYRQHSRYHARLANEMLSTLSAEEAETLLQLLEKTTQVL